MSSLIKSDRVVPLEDFKKLELIRKYVPAPQKISGSDGDSEGNTADDVEIQSLKERILSDAERTAQEILRQAREAAAEIKAAAEAEAEAWWQTKRGQDASLEEEARRRGYEDGYHAGVRQAEEDVRQEWSEQMREARVTVEQAYAAKERVIAEAETFLVELSCSIAEKLISRELTEQSPELAVSLFAKALSRRKEQGVITLCVSPSQFAFVQAAKDELSLALDSQADLQIVPDAGIGEGGCIVRSAFGSIDARIDTQLAAVRAELLRVAAHAAEEVDPDGTA
ncbi:flagellar assembly protein FliH [Cohnella pontilimi]|uniref:Flagellar assembly protein FliH n=1 Tax=Cohnella pontilimi TaxID=2564100 RepID=A0A4U0FEH0_9BACL|nr:FliH/SctL family protein [Cohnella pontilimi]TJY43190.1 flagellar assembly protein FliH [Cohnella pontilimi]